MSQTKAQLVAGTSDQTVAANTVTTTNIKNPSSGSNNIVFNADGSIGGTCLTQTCRAWVNFDGTGTVAIRASYNVSSITDNGVGDYTVNFTTAMPDANYAAISESNVLGVTNNSYQSIVCFNSQTASSVRFNSVSDYPFLAASVNDKATVFVAIFR